MTAVTLAFDTSTSATSVALLVGGEVSEARSQSVAGLRPDHSTSLLVLAKGLLADSGLGFDDVTRLAVGLGPGTFTGIRIGMSVAQGLAIGRSCELVGVGSLRALIEADGQSSKPVVGLIDARRSELFCCFREPSGVLAHPFAVRLGAVGEQIPTGALCVGDGALLASNELRSAGFEVPDTDDHRHRVRASVIARLAETPDQPGPQLVPVYVRNPDAVPVSERSK